MNAKELYENGTAQLDRILDFFPRVESKITALFALNTAMVGIITLNTKPEDFKVNYLLAVGCATLVLLIISLWSLYVASYPQLRGGTRSIIYFREIAKRTEANYLREMKQCTEMEFAEQILQQIWRNSEILTKKYDSVKRAFICTAIALPFWAITLLIETYNHKSLLLNI